MSTEDDKGTEIGRRGFLRCVGGGIAVLTLTPLGCSNDDDDPATCEGLQASSRVTSRHTHTVCIPMQDLSNPPAGGGTYVTSNFTSDDGGYAGGAHTHMVTLTAANLGALAAGSSVTTASSESELHIHDFVIRAS